MIADVNIFKQSVPIIKSLVMRWSDRPADDIDDCVQECWFTFVRAMSVAYQGDRPESIFAYLKAWYRHRVWNYLRRGRKYIPAEELYEIEPKEPDLDEVITQYDLSVMLTKEELEIVYLRLEGYEKSEITDIILPNNNYNSKKSKDVYTYRKMVAIKAKLAKYLGHTYHKPKLDREV